MAHVQQSDIPDKHKAAIDKLMEKDAVEVSKEKCVVHERPHDIMKAKILNCTLGLNIQLLKHHVWLGSVLGAYPPEVKRGYSAGITSRGAPARDPNGSKIAIVYQGSNVEDGPNNCAWLLAWHAPGDGTSEPKVYVEAGDVHKYSDDQFDWDNVESNLNASSNESYYRDDDTGAEASARIGKASYITKASVVFDVQID